MNKIIIIQPTTSERVLASIAQCSYWLYAALKKKNKDVILYEDVTLLHMDEIFDYWGKDTLYLIELSNYPQIDIVNQIFLEKRNFYNMKCFGYSPLIQLYNHPELNYKEDLDVELIDGVFDFIFYHKDYKNEITFDGDSHIKITDGDTRPFVSVYLGVGCKRGCPYCCLSAFDYPYGDCSIEKAKEIIDFCVKNNFNIHFRNENFFHYKYLDELLEYLQGKNLKYICLSDSLTLKHILQKYGEDYLLSSGNFLTEIGLETIDTKVLNKKQDFSIVDCKLNLFWLTITFQPDETITSLNQTGEFLRLYGKQRHELLEGKGKGTNSTIGGLGQFFQYYHGTEFFKDLNQKGVILTSRPIRLYPSFVGYKFLDCKPYKYRRVSEEDKQWFDLYFPDVIPEVLSLIDGQKSVIEIIQDKNFKEISIDIKKLVVVAQLAKLGIIKE